MKTFVYSLVIVVLGLGVFTACSESNAPHPFAGTFLTENGIRFELKADSTTFIQFNDSVTYESTWMINRSGDNLEYATIEFAGYPTYYFLKDGKLYRSEREMRHDALGIKVKYQD